MDKSLQFPGVSNAWTMPIKARIDMLSTGIRTPVGVKVFGKDLAEIDKVARQIEAVIRNVPGTSSAYAERAVAGYYLNVDPDREQLARYGLMVGDVQNVIAMALGAEPVTTTVEGRERYTRQPPLSARLPQRSRGHREPGPDPDAGRRDGSVRSGRQGQPRARPVEHPHRERAARNLHLCRSPRPRPRELRRRRTEGRGSRGEISRLAITRSGAGSSNISSAPRPGSRSSCR